MEVKRKLFYWLDISNFLYIIVLLILAAVSIATLTGDNGILTKANNAKTQNTEGEEKEQIGLAYDAVMADNYEAGNYNAGVTASQLQGHLTKQNVKATATGEADSNSITVKFADSGNSYTVDGKTGEITGPTNIGKNPPTTGDEPGKPNTDGIFTESSTIDGKTKPEENTEAASKNPIIPAGFKPVETETAKWKEGVSAPQTDNGLVIEDIDHNQFVWVPVPDISEFITIGGDTGEEPYREGYATEKSEYEAMKESVKNNGGFYIGRYEAGKDASDNVIVQKDATVYNNIKWGNAMDDITEGAVKKAQEFKNEKAYENSVTSTLIYGVQWDATMQFMDNNYKDEACLAGSYVIDSAGKGWYSDNYKNEIGGNPDHKTGIDLKDENGNIVNCVKNIYDMAGNISEWTMETYERWDGDFNRVYRGGYYNNDGSIYSASDRSNIYSFDGYDYIGFRVTLYVNV